MNQIHEKENQVSSKSPSGSKPCEKESRQDENKSLPESCEKESKQDKDKSLSGSEISIIEITIDDSDNPDRSYGDFYCKVCDSHMNSSAMWEAHVTGRRHIKNVLKGDTDSKYEDLDVESYTKNDIKNVTDPVLGLSYIHEIRRRESGFPAMYNCFLCHASIATVPLVIEHVTGVKHQLNFMKPLREACYWMRWLQERARHVLGLLNMDVNKWVHLNCALWSYEVYETVNGALMNVEVALKRSRHLSCYSCHKQGASVRCFKTRCPNVYHFPCAKKEQCAFYKDKTVLCPQHVHKGNPENRLDSVAVFRRVYINREEHKQVASMIQDDKYVMRVGSLIFLNIGQLLPTQIQAFHTTNCIYPVGYKVIRMYWSMKKMGRRSQYICTINEVSGKPEFSIQVKDLDQKDMILKDKTAKGVWQKVLYPIEKMRKQAKTIKTFPDFITGDDLFGLTEPAVLRIVESLPGIDTLYDYNFRYGRSPFLELPLAINPTGCARAEPKLRTHFKRSHTLHTSNTTRSFHSAFAGIYPEVSSPYIKQFVHSKSSQYRKMKTEWRNNVYLARSRIQGLGLYAARDMEKHTMVIEYIGQLIRNEIAERNEAIYNAQNRGTYMFRLDENRVIDATLSGGLARYINHSCYPNCTTEVVQIDRENKILIITNRRVTRGEELSYDYKFEVEDDQHKIPCLCGAPNCRKWMN